MRWLSLVTGAALLAIAFGAATRVADSREGLIAEIVTLLAGLLGISLVLYGFFAGARPAPRPAVHAPALQAAPSARQLAAGITGLVLAAVLLGGLLLSAGWQWAALGTVLLLPMIVGSVLLCRRYLRAR